MHWVLGTHGSPDIVATAVMGLRRTLVRTCFSAVTSGNACLERFQDAKRHNASGASGRRGTAEGT
jgi:hypothetical protein